MLVSGRLRDGGAGAVDGRSGDGSAVGSDELHRFVLCARGEVVVDEGVERRLLCLLCVLRLLLLLQLALLLGVLSRQPLLVLVEQEALLCRG